MSKRSFSHWLRTAGVAVAVAVTAVAPWRFDMERGFGSAEAHAFAQSPILTKFVNKLPGLGYANRNDLGQYIPIANKVANPQFPNDDYYEFAEQQFTTQMHSDLLPLYTASGTTGTKVRGYVDLHATDPNPQQYLGPAIIATRNTPVRLKVSNQLTGAAANLFLPVDTTIMGAMDPQNRTVVHLHGGRTPWISDGTPFQWFTPTGMHGVSFHNVPDMPDPGVDGANYYYTNAQSARLLFYHDHAMGITRLNVYGGLAAPYIITEPAEQALITAGTLPDLGVPLIIQDKSFVAANTGQPTASGGQDPTWDLTNWGKPGDLWYPHVYEPNQNFADGTINPSGRWDYGAWVWPPVANPAPMIPPAVSQVAEQFGDTPVVNGTAYPYMEVKQQMYRFRVLNACNSRMLNLQLYKEGTVTPPATGPYANPYAINAATGTYTNAYVGEADLGNPGPPILVIGNEGGFLPMPAERNNPPQQTTKVMDMRAVNFGNINLTNLFLGPAERSDILIDFAGLPVGATLILYNDMDAPAPMGDMRNDYYTGDMDYTATTGNTWGMSGGAPTTAPGKGPSTRTIMKFTVVAGGANTPTYATVKSALSSPTTGLPAVFAQTQDAPIIPTRLTSPTGTDATVSMSATTLTGANGIVYPNILKTLAEDFDLYGRMNALLGTEVSSLNAQGQQTFGYPFAWPPTDIHNFGETHVWTLSHQGVDTHVVHFHLFDVQLVTRTDWANVPLPPSDYELGWKETVRANPLENITFAMRFKQPPVPFGIPDSVRLVDPMKPKGTVLTSWQGTAVNDYTNYGWEYVWHCHILEHEENDMMRPIVAHHALPAKLVQMNLGME